MTAHIRTLLLLTIATILVAACGASAGSPASQSADPTQPTDPSVEPSETPAESPAEEREVAGTITVAEGMTVSGPGITVQEALDAGSSGDSPSLVNGVLFLDTDGTIYLATSVSDVDVPTFDGPMLEVLNMDNTGDSWDMANAELLGLEEADGIVFKQEAQVLGFLEVH